jgi:DHA1 family bicyclomycin/chloramphenicol resistance-like MFS transporter
MLAEPIGLRTESGASERTRVLFLVSLSAFLVPITTTIYLPALSIIETDLHTTSLMVGLTIGGYVLLAGLMPLVYGPYADRLGRRRILLVSLALYVLTSLLCSLAWNIQSLIAFRTLQAVGVSAAMVVGAGCIADVYPPRARGRAMGAFGVAPLIGPVIGPVLGGAIAHAVGWRRLFLVLTGLGLVVLVAVALWLPETLRRDHVPTTPPRPWEPLLLLRNRSLLLLSCLGAAAFGTMYAALTMLPLLLGSTYGLGPLEIGLLLLPSGIASMLGTVAGGIAADRFGRKRSFIGGTVALVPLVALFGAVVTTTLGVAITLLSGIGFFLALARPAMSTYAIETTPHHASGVTAASMAVALVAAAICTTAGPALTGAIGAEGFFGILAAIVMLLTVVAGLSMDPDASLESALERTLP